MTTKAVTKKHSKKKSSTRTPRRIPGSNRSNRRKYYAFCETIENAAPAAAAIVIYRIDHSTDYGEQFDPQEFAREVAAQAKLIADEIVSMEMLKRNELGLKNDFMCR